MPRLQPVPKSLDFSNCRRSRQIPGSCAWRHTFSTVSALSYRLVAINTANVELTDPYYPRPDQTNLWDVFSANYETTSTHGYCNVDLEDHLKREHLPRPKEFLQAIEARVWKKKATKLFVGQSWIRTRGPLATNDTREPVKPTKSNNPNAGREDASPKVTKEGIIFYLIFVCLFGWQSGKTIVKVLVKETVLSLIGTKKNKCTCKEDKAACNEVVDQQRGDRPSQRRLDIAY